MFELSKTGSTTTLKRHLESYKKRARPEKGQKEIQLAPITEDGTTITVTNFNYDKERTRKMLVKMIMLMKSY